jgi:hypothetical protein
MNWMTAYSFGREHQANIANKAIEIAIAEQSAQQESEFITAAQARELGEAYGRKQALEDVANGFIKQKSWTQSMAHAVVQHAADEGALK